MSLGSACEGAADTDARRAIVAGLSLINSFRGDMM